ncbi:hydroxymethylglutaryl-CoA reductase (NADPH) [Methanospirillum sp. J.3.6.1-F.2.7.3]|uniref:3-hydroxy-3-methylglutaryl coenzyme A reductase n=1 Tax=Methanospirillum purgamenti TaxID=2834276 RepID=A0A8E7EK51_9EURY|nr:MULTISPECIES: hydroxymethylglutaryl-CoA reductase (NADPH) [Methanospirillum]MDX8549403.1 hydroxymethylglutaryl-CoA reductase (NADPH) [Methanospirillum hungatei]NLW74865.1 hydroxymethylglutaryl-CoA reductase (NADPH) [Methanomicrobiales archaeon]QVV89311.1 hydroxymethylglutaryl-CoA reductase (NADPH) [Methanospirillum sp. J.3.6.1-F.2.7.3]
MDEYLRRLRDGSLKLYALEKELPPDKAVAIRRRFIEEETNTKLEHIGDLSISLDAVVKKNCENMIGTIQVPVGVAGPIMIHGEYAEGSYYLPLATTEGALIASVNRGCSLISAAGGTEVRILKDGMTRAPVFAADSIIHAKTICDWVMNHQDEIRAEAEATTRFGKLTTIDVTTGGTSVFVRMAFFTGDAMGMNMVTIASAKAADLISQKTGARLIALSGNWCTDKKPASINAVMGRGKTVSAGILLTNELIERVLKTTASSLLEVNARKNLVGSARAGSLGFNAHAANIIAAMFIACGQDPAHVVEGSLCITTVDSAPDGVYVSVTLPALPVGTVGGGTGIDTQAESLRMLDVLGSGTPPGSNAKKLAEIIASGVLAGELSLLGALAAQHLARAHSTLGR